MAGSPKLKVYNPSGDYVAACKHGEDAAAIVAGSGDGATIRLGHSRVVWREGAESFVAGESYDGVANLIAERIEAINRKGYAAAYGRESI
jgi:hypothetical protein